MKPIIKKIKLKTIFKGTNSIKEGTIQDIFKMNLKRHIFLNVFIFVYLSICTL